MRKCPQNLRQGDLLPVRVMGGGERLTVEQVEVRGRTVAVKLSWGSHVPLKPFWQTFSKSELVEIAHVPKENGG